jgi:hypothetical protein
VLTKPGPKVRVLGGEGAMGVRVRRGLSVNKSKNIRNIYLSN